MVGNRCFCASSARSRGPSPRTVCGDAWTRTAPTRSRAIAAKARSFRGGVRIDRPELKAELFTGGVGGSQEGPVRGGGTVQEDANPAHPRHGLLEDLEPFRSEI